MLAIGFLGAPQACLGKPVDAQMLGRIAAMKTLEEIKLAQSQAPDPSVPRPTKRAAKSRVGDGKGGDPSLPVYTPRRKKPKLK